MTPGSGLTYHYGLVGGSAVKPPRPRTPPGDIAEKAMRNDDMSKSANRHNRWPCPHDPPGRWISCDVRIRTETKGTKILCAAFTPHRKTYKLKPT